MTLREERVKDRVIFNVSKFIDTKDEKHRDQAISDLLLMSKKFHLSLKKKGRKTDLKQSWYNFIVNNEGYIRTIPQLYYNLLQ